jgi:hypothetical protein
MIDVSEAEVNGTWNRLTGRLCYGWLGILLVLFCVFSAAAQLTGKGAITGRVTDPSGAVIANAIITANNDATGISTTTRTTGSGDYTFSALDPGIYTVTVEATGFERQIQRNVHVDAMQSQPYNPVLTVGAATSEITVSTAPPLLETSNATLGGTMENAEYSALPLQMGGYGQNGARRATDFSFLMPGFQSNTTHNNVTDNTSVVNGSGSQGGVTAVYIDGIPFTNASGEGDVRTVDSGIDVEAIDQFQVQTNGYSALYEGMGVENYSIKQGGDQYHGTIYEYLRNTALDTWGFFGPILLNPETGLPQKPVEHQNEFGIFVSGPIIQHKLFFFGHYGQYRYAANSPTYTTFPTLAERNGNFSATGVAIYDPNTQAACTANSTTGTCRYQYGYVAGTGVGPAGNPVLGSAGSGGVNVIPTSELSPVALKMQSFLPQLANQNLANNFLAPNTAGSVKWDTTDRFDYVITPKDTLTLLGAYSRSASASPTNQTTAGRNVGPLPYNFGQASLPKSVISAIEENHVFTSRLLNQFKYGYFRYYDPTINVNTLNTAQSATAMGIANLPAGQTQQSFPFETWSGTDAPTNWAGEPGSLTVANSYYALDNVQWVFGKHSLTIGGQIAWMDYNDITVSTGTSPLTLAYAVTETAGFKNASTLLSGTGLSYASFLIGQVDKPSLTVNSHVDIGGRFRPISPYVQDDWKVTPKLTLNLGLRYDFFPTYHEAHNILSYFNPTLTNPVTGSPGAIEYAGSVPSGVSGVTTCNCATPVSNYYKNFGPRLGFAYQLDQKTVIRGSWGVMYAHGNAVGGAAISRTGTGTLGFSASPSFSSNTSTYLSTAPMPEGAAGTSWNFPSFTPAAGVASGNAYGTGYTTTSGYTGSPSSLGYGDPYYGGRAPQYLNWSFGVQRQLTNSIVATISYVGSEGHFMPSDGGNARGYWVDAVDPKYLSLGSYLGTAVNSLPGGYAAFAAANSLPYYPWFANQSLSTALEPFPQYKTSDSYGNVSNENYHSLQVVVNKQISHGLLFYGSYTHSRAIDDGGTFRTGYPIPAGTIANHPTISYPADRIERQVSTTNEPQQLKMTGVWDLPIGQGYLGGRNAVSRAILGGFKLSGIAQFLSGSPLILTASSCPTNPAQSTCEPILNPGFSGPARANGSWGKGITAANPNAISYIAPSTGTTTSNASGPFMNPVSGILSSYAYQFSDSPRTAPYNLYGPGNYDIDVSLRRDFALHLTEASHLSLQIDSYNLTNHTQFGGIGQVLGSTGFGSVSSQANQSRRMQLSGRLIF